MMADKKVIPVTKPANITVTNTSTGVSTSTGSKPSSHISGSQRAQVSQSSTLFYKENYVWMLAGLAIIALGMFLMSGGQSKDPNVFDQKEVYSTTRITIAPLLIIIGLGLEVFAIFRKPKN